MTTEEKKAAAKRATDLIKELMQANPQIDLASWSSGFLVSYLAMMACSDMPYEKFKASLFRFIEGSKDAFDREKQKGDKNHDN